MRNLKLYSTLIFATPFFVIFSLWILILVFLKRRNPILDELAEIYEDLILKDIGLTNPRKKYLFETFIDLAVHTSLIFWISLLVFTLS